MEKKIRVLVAKVGLDGHDRGAKVVAAHLRDQGMEVIYSGLRQTPEMIIESAIQEDVDVIGISILSGAHMNLFPEILDLMKKNNLLDEMLLIGGGIISSEDAKVLKEKGVGEIFGPGTPLKEISDYIKKWYKSKVEVY